MIVFVTIQIIGICKQKQLSILITLQLGYQTPYPKCPTNNSQNPTLQFYEDCGANYKLYRYFLSFPTLKF